MHTSRIMYIMLQKKNKAGEAACSGLSIENNTHGIEIRDPHRIEMGTSYTGGPLPSSYCWTMMLRC